jgi:hypothetical protein
MMGAAPRAKAAAALGRPLRRQRCAVFAPRSTDAVEAADLVTDGDQSLMDVPLAVVEPGEVSSTVTDRGQPSLTPASGPAVVGRGRRCRHPSVATLGACPLFGLLRACQLSGLRVAATAARLGHRRWCVLIGRLAGFGPRYRSTWCPHCGAELEGNMDDLAGVLLSLLAVGVVAALAPVLVLCFPGRECHRSCC